MRAYFLTFGLLACGGPSTTTPPPANPPSSPLPPPVAAAPTCDRASAAPPGGRRLEAKINTAPGSAELMIDGQRQVASQSGSPSCGFIPLSPGAHEVTLRAQADTRVGVSLDLAIENPKGPWWYDVFTLDCGIAGACTKEHLTAWRKRVEGDRKSLTDPCSAVQVRKITWENQRAAGSEQISTLTLNFTLFLYKEPFDMGPRDPNCPEN